MRGEPDLASVAALIGDPSRAAILVALADGRALPAGELAAVAGLSPSGASAHLSRLLQGGLLAAEQEGRHRYYRLAGPQVAEALEGLAPLATTMPHKARMPSPAAEALRRGRTCYDHLAGEIGVTLARGLERRGLVVAGEGKRLTVTEAGARWFADLGIDIAALRPGRHGLARRCLDWTERWHHVGGPLGAALLRRCYEAGWIIRADRNTRAVQLSPAGAVWMRDAVAIG